MITYDLVQAIVALAEPMAEGRHTRLKAVKLSRGDDMERINALKLNKNDYAKAVGVALVLVALR